MTTLGRLKTCDVCGKKIFQEHNPFVDCYDDNDNDWENIDGIGDMCPECSKAYHNLVDALISERGGIANEIN